MFARAPNPSRANMDKVTEDYFTIYQQEDPYPPGRQLATHANSFQIKDDVPSSADVETSVQSLRLHNSVVHIHLRAEHFKTRIREAYPGEGANPPPPPNLEVKLSSWT